MTIAEEGGARVPRTGIGRQFARLGAPTTLYLIVLAAITVGAAAIRLVSLGWGSPYAYHPDEWTIVKTAMRMVETGDWNPHVFYYPSLLINLQAGLTVILRSVAGLPLATDQAWLFQSEALPDQFGAFLAGRTMVLLMGVATIPATFLLGRRLGGGWAGLIAAAWIAIAPLHALSSRYATTDVPMTFLCTLVALAAVRGYQEPERERWWLMAGLLTGLAASTKWNAALIAIIPALLYLWTRPGRWRVPGALRSRTPYLMAGLALAGLVLTTPAILFATEEVAEYLRLQATLYSVVSWNEQTPGLLYQLHALTYKVGWPAGLMLGAGFAWLALRGGPVGRAFVAYILAYVVVLAIPAVHFERNALPMLPLLAVGVGLLVTDAARTIGRYLSTHGGRLDPRVLTGSLAIIVAIVLAPGLATTLSEARRLRHHDTRTLALHWIRETIPGDAILAREQYTPQLTPEDYRMRNRAHLWERRLDWYRELGVNYLVVSAANTVRFLDNPAAPWPSEFYHEVFELPEVYRVDPDEIHNGYTIWVLRLQPIEGGP